MKRSLRQLAQSPGFTLVAVLTLALGIGANTAIFSVVEAALLRPLPFPEPDRLVRLYEAFDEPDTRANTVNLSELTVRDWRGHGGAIFSGLSAATGASVTLAGGGDVPPRSLRAARIAADFLPVLGLPPALGRNFTAAEDRPGGPRVVLVGHDFWRRELGGRADAIGQVVRLDDAPYTVVGVMPENFRHPYRAEVWLPLAADFDPAQPRGHYLYGVARLAPGVSVAQADLAVRRLCAELNAARPDAHNPRRAYIRPLREGFVVDLRPKLLVIGAAALCTLLVAAANFAGLLLARSAAREGEIAVRAALGATRGRLIRETLGHSLLLAGLGAAAGVVLALWLTPALVALSPEGSDATGSAMREFDFAVRLDWPVFAFAAGAMLLAGAVFGLLPAARAGRVDLRSSLGARGASLDRATSRRLAQLVVAEIAVATVLLAASALFAQHFRQLSREPWGFATDQRLGFKAMLSDRLFADGESRLRTIDATVAQLRALPGVRSVTATVPHPLEAARDLIGVNVDGVPAPRGYRLAYLRGALPGYFATVGQPLLRGRDFADTDRAGAPAVCIVNETFARRFWPGRDPLGQRVKWGRIDGPRPWFTVVGVAADTKAIVDPDDGDVDGTICVPLRQLLAFAPDGYDEQTFVLETAAAPRALVSAARAALARADARLAAYEVDPFDEIVAQTRVTERFALVLISVFGALGLLLSAIGLYGLLALQVARRMREFGIRAALGATGGAIVRLVFARGAALLALGLLAGSLAAAFAVQLAQTRWPELPALNPLSCLAAAAALALAAALACWLPARRATKADPISALRSE